MLSQRIRRHGFNRKSTFRAGRKSHSIAL
jgi:hypothetical protein